MPRCASVLAILATVAIAHTAAQDRRTASSEPRPTKNPLEGNRQAISTGGAMFRTRCAGCHGPDARGYLGPDLTGIGFALGMERLVMLLPKGADKRRCDVFLAPLVSEALDPALLLQRDLRRAGLRVLLDHEGRGLKSQMKKADKLGARFVAIRGEDERAKDVWVVRDMAGSSQEEVGARDMARHLQGKLRG